MLTRQSNGMGQMLLNTKGTSFLHRSIKAKTLIALLLKHFVLLKFPEVDMKEDNYHLSYLSLFNLEYLDPA